MATAKRVYVAIVGVGGVGTAFLAQLADLSERLSRRKNRPVDICVVYIGRSAVCLLASPEKPIFLDGRESELASSTTTPLSPTELANFLAKLPGPSLLVDNTSSQTVAEAYPLFLRTRTHVVTPNKKAFSSSLAIWNSVFDVAANYGNAIPWAGSLFFGPAVHPRIPIVSVLQDIQDTEDQITRIEGVFSGTMSVLFNSFSPLAGHSDSFSTALRNARDLGYTEPDPREDLNGMDVVRKLTTIARLCGMQIEPASVKVQSLVPGTLRDVVDGEVFISQLAGFDEEWAKTRDLAEQEGKVLRYVGSIDATSGELRVGVRKHNKSHPFAALRGTDNSISIYSRQYGDNPFTMQGGASGATLTAAGIIKDLLKVVNLVA